MEPWTSSAQTVVPKVTRSCKTVRFKWRSHYHILEIKTLGSREASVCCRSMRTWIQGSSTLVWPWVSVTPVLGGSRELAGPPSEQNPVSSDSERTLSQGVRQRVIAKDTHHGAVAVHNMGTHTELQTYAHNTHIQINKIPI